MPAVQELALDSQPESAWALHHPRCFPILCVSILKEVTASVKCGAEILPGAPGCSHPTPSSSKREARGLPLVAIGPASGPSSSSGKQTCVELRTEPGRASGTVTAREP